jgi:hypothetical protein
VLVRDLIHDKQHTFFVGDLYPFFGDAATAAKMARLDDDQELILDILAYRGEPRLRTSMEFHIAFADGSLLWIPWSNDLFDTVPYEVYIRSKPALRPLLYRLKDLSKEDKIISATPITSVKEGDIVFIDLRSYGYSWYHSLNLPQHDYLTYVVEYVYESFNAERTVATVFCHIFKERWKVDHIFVLEYGSCLIFDSSYMVRVDTMLIKKFPALVKNTASKAKKNASLARNNASYKKKKDQSSM